MAGELSSQMPLWVAGVEMHVERGRQNTCLQDISAEGWESWGVCALILISYSQGLATENRNFQTLSAATVLC